MEKKNQGGPLLIDLGLIKEKFWSVSRVGFEKVMSDAPSVWGGPEAADYEFEKRIIKGICKPFGYGLVATCLTFVTFRISANRSFQNWRQRSFGIPITYKKTPKPKESTDSNCPEWKSYSARQYEARAAYNEEYKSLPWDMVLSMLLGFSITALTLRTDEWKAAFVEAPIFPGKSLSCKYLCNDMNALIHRIDPSVWRNEKKDDVLESLRIFTINCHLRNEILQKIRQKSNFLEEQEIPFPKEIWVQRLKSAMQKNEEK